MRYHDSTNVVFIDEKEEVAPVEEEVAISPDTAFAFPGIDLDAPLQHADKEDVADATAVQWHGGEQQYAIQAEEEEVDGGMGGEGEGDFDDTATY